MVSLGNSDTPPLVIFIGDGVSDLTASREADILFARAGLRLEEFCLENKIPYIPFESFSDIQYEIEKIILNINYSHVTTPQAEKHNLVSFLKIVTYN